MNNTFNERRRLWNINHPFRFRIPELLHKLATAITYTNSVDMQLALEKLIEETTKEEAIMMARTVTHLTEEVYLKKRKSNAKRNLR